MNGIGRRRIGNLSLADRYISYYRSMSTSKTILMLLAVGSSKSSYLIEDGDSTTPLGKVTLFDYNPRNHSKEVGYYIPPSFRGKGLGFVMLSFLLTRVLSKDRWTEQDLRYNVI